MRMFLLGLHFWNTIEKVLKHLFETLFKHSQNNYQHFLLCLYLHQICPQVRLWHHHHLHQNITQVCLHPKLFQLYLHHHHKFPQVCHWHNHKLFKLCLNLHQKRPQVCLSHHQKFFQICHHHHQKVTQVHLEQNPKLF